MNQELHRKPDIWLYSLSQIVRYGIQRLHEFVQQDLPSLEIQKRYPRQLGPGFRFALRRKIFKWA